MTDRDALLRTIRESPGDDGPRLVYADWCDEHGQADLARFIRLCLAVPRREAEVLEVQQHPRPNVVGYLVRGEMDDPAEAVAETLRQIPFELFPGAALERLEAERQDPGWWRVNAHYTRPA